MTEYKLIVAGGRDFNNVALFEETLQQLVDEVPDHFTVSLVSGMARGADALGYQFAKRNGIKCYEFHADWNQYGKRAGFMRNEDMGRFSNGLLAFWDGQSRGTKHMIMFMESLGKPVRVIRY